MRRFTLMMGLMTITLGVTACGPETRTVVRRETVQTQTVQPAPVVIEKRTVVEPDVTVIHPEPVQPQRRVYEERRTTIEE